MPSCSSEPSGADVHVFVVGSDALETYVAGGGFR